MVKKIIVGLGELLWDLLPSGERLGGAPANFAVMASRLGNRGVIASLTAVIVLYAVLGVATVLILRLLARRWRQGDEGEASVPYGPPRRPARPIAGEGAS